VSARADRVQDRPGLHRGRQLLEEEAVGLAVQRPERIEHEMFDLEFRKSMIMLDSIMLRCINTGLAAAVNSCAGTGSAARGHHE
jgi:hypothetical protein